MKNPFKTMVGYYGVADTLRDDDDRLPKYKAQYDAQGWDDTVTWNLFYEICEFTLPKLKRFKEINNGHPAGLTEDSWNDKLDSMIAWMELVLKDQILYSDEEHEIMDTGLTAFKEYFYNLWW